MPGIGGFEATRKLLRNNPDIKVLVVTICKNDLYPISAVASRCFGLFDQRSVQ